MTMILPRFTIRTGLMVVTLCALAFVVAGMAVRGETWAWGITIGLVSLVVTLVIHAAWFSLVSTFARMPAAQPAEVVGATRADDWDAGPSESVVKSPANRAEAES